MLSWLYLTPKAQKGAVIEKTSSNVCRLCSVLISALSLTEVTFFVQIFGLTYTAHIFLKCSSLAWNYAPAFMLFRYDDMLTACSWASTQQSRGSTWSASLNRLHFCITLQAHICNHPVECVLCHLAELLKKQKEKNTGKSDQKEKSGFPQRMFYFHVFKNEIVV